MLEFLLVLGLSEFSQNSALDKKDYIIKIKQLNKKMISDTEKHTLDNMNWTDQLRRSP